MVAHYTPESPLVSAQWLKSHLLAPDVRVIDATWFMPGAPRSGRQTYDAHHIPRSRFFDIDEIADTASPYPHMLPLPEKFASRARKLGLGDGHRIICYDQNGFCASARVWWMFRAMGHDDVAVLDGGYEAWKAAGGEIEDLPPLYPTDRHFTCRPRRDLMRDRDQVNDIIQGGGAQIVDARSAARFNAEVDEPRPGLRRGHIPSSINLPHNQVIGPGGLMKSPDELRAVFTASGVDLTRPIVNTCGSGVTAAILALAQAVAGHDDSAVYDAGWCEWGAEGSGLPVETG